METSPSGEQPMESVWRDYGKLILLLELQEAVRADWNGTGIRLWAEQQLRALESEAIS